VIYELSEKGKVRIFDIAGKIDDMEAGGKNKSLDMFDKFARQDQQDAETKLIAARYKTKIAEAEALEREYKARTANVNPAPVAANNVQSIMQQAGVAPEKTAEFMNKLDDQGLQRLIMLTQPNQAAFLQYAQKPDTTVTQMLEVINMVEKMRSSQPAGQPSGSQGITIETLPTFMTSIIALSEKFNPPHAGGGQNPEVANQLKEMRDLISKMRDDAHATELKGMVDTFNAKIDAIEGKYSNLQGLDKEERQEIRKDDRADKEWKRMQADKRIGAELEDKKYRKIFKWIEDLTGEDKPLGKIIDKGADAAASKLNIKSKVKKTSIATAVQPTEEKVICPYQDCKKDFTIEFGAVDVECPHCKRALHRANVEQKTQESTPTPKKPASEK